MTALHQYARLEASGLWRSHPQAQRREVIVGLREATIVLLDPKTEMPLAQWSLPAILRVAAVEGFVIFSPHEDQNETLELDDPAMIEALDKVRAVVDRRRKRPGRLRMGLSMAVSAALIAGLGIWTPMRFFDFAAQRLPEAARRDVAALALRDIAVIAGSPCTGVTGMAATSDLARRLSPQNPPKIQVLRSGLTAPHSLADGTVLLPFALIEAADGPDTVAGIVLAERLRAAQADPLEDALRYAGLIASIRLLSSGALPDTALAGYGLSLPKDSAAQNAPAPNSALLHAAFAQAVITSAPYAAFAQDESLTKMPDAAPQGSDPIVLDDAAFLGLKYICDS